MQTFTNDISRFATWKSCFTFCTNLSRSQAEVTSLDGINGRSIQTLLREKKRREVIGWNSGYWFDQSPLSGFWPLYVGCLIKISAFYFTSFTDLAFSFQLFLLCVFKSIKIVPLTFLFLRSSLLNTDTDTTASVRLVSILTGFHCILEQFLSGASIALRTDDVTKRNPHRDSEKHWPFLQEVARALYGNAQFAISSARPFSVLRNVPVSKFEEDPGEYNVEQIKT